MHRDSRPLAVGAKRLLFGAALLAMSFSCTSPAPARPRDNRSHEEKMAEIDSSPEVVAATERMEKAYALAAIEGERLFTSDDAVLDYIVSTAGPYQLEWAQTICSAVYASTLHPYFVDSFTKQMMTTAEDPNEQRAMAVKSLAALRRAKANAQADQ